MFLLEHVYLYLLYVIFLLVLLRVGHCPARVACRVCSVLLLCCVGGCSMAAGNGFQTLYGEMRGFLFL